jgi:hypothetical protein
MGFPSGLDALSARNRRDAPAGGGRDCTNPSPSGKHRSRRLLQMIVRGIDDQPIAPQSIRLAMEGGGTCQ